MAMGIWGLLLKEYAPEALLDCLRQVISGEKWLPAELVSKAAHAPQDSGERKIELLTRREREITELICGGLSNRCIADTLGTSEGTITVHLQNIYQKLEITNRTALAALHVQYRIVRDGRGRNQGPDKPTQPNARSTEDKLELQSLMRI